MAHNPHRRPAVQLFVLSLFALIILSSLSTLAQAENLDFPLREQYKDLEIIETDFLHDHLDNYTVVDVRSEYEYTILHIAGAIHIPVTDFHFAKKAKEARDKMQKPLVFYCNGITCRKSYKAGRQIHRAGIIDSKVYDAGIFHWGKTYPQQTILLDNRMEDANQLISKEQLEAHMLSPDQFSEKVPSSVVVDIRNAITRAGLSLFVGREKAIPLDKRHKLDVQIQRAISENKPLLVYDATGRQVRWLQYYLEHAGVEDYWFMKGGADGFFKFYQNR